MRVAKIPAEIVEAKVLESLRSRMDPVSRRVYPSWKLMMREIGVCRQRIADAVKIRLEPLPLRSQPQAKGFRISADEGGFKYHRLVAAVHGRGKIYKYSCGKMDGHDGEGIAPKRPSHIR